MTTIQGVIHGKTIELERPPGLPDGEIVAVTIQRITDAVPPVDPELVRSVDVWMERLVFDSSVLPGERIVKGTRLSAEDLVAELQRGASAADLLQAHTELSDEDVQALCLYAQVPAGIRSSAGSWAEDGDDLDKFIEWTYAQRKLSGRGLEP